MRDSESYERIEVPKHFYNVQSVLDLPPPMGDNVKLLPEIFPGELLRQEMSREKYEPIPEEVREAMSKTVSRLMARASGSAETRP